MREVKSMGLREWFSRLRGGSSQDVTVSSQPNLAGFSESVQGSSRDSISVNSSAVVSQDEELARTAVQIANEAANSWRMVSDNIFSEKHVACSKREETESSLLSLRSLAARLLDLGNKLSSDVVDIRDPIDRIKSDARQRMTTNERNALQLVMNLSSSIDSVKSNIGRITNERIALVKSQPRSDEESVVTQIVSKSVQEIRRDLDELRFGLDDFLKFTIKIEKETAAYVAN